MAVPKRLRFEVFRRDNHTCRYCGRAVPDVKLTIDHVVPEVLGGGNEPSNLVTACADCNGGKTSISPDSPLIAQVADDAVRWALAQQSAAKQMLAERGARLSLRSQFKDHWETWGWGDGAARQTEPLPGNWGQSVDQLIDAGLPMEILLDSVDKAQSNSKIRDTFAYTCGIAWNRVKELQKRTAAELGIPNPATVAQITDLEVTWDGVLCQLAGHPDERDRYLAEARDDAQGDLSDAEAVPLAVEIAVGRVTTDLWTYRRALDTLMLQMPADRLSAARADAKADATQFDYEPSAADFANSMASSLAAAFAADYLEELNEAEREEWRAGARALLAGRDNLGMVDRVAAEYARRIKAGGSSDSRMCAQKGDHGAMCPGRVTASAFLVNCPICAETEQGECTGHPLWCEKHLIAIKQGRYAYGDGAELALSSVVAISTDDPWAF